MRNSYTINLENHVPGVVLPHPRRHFMRLTLAILSFVLSASAFANITCKGAIQYSLPDVVKNQIDLIDGSLNFEDALLALDDETGRHRDVILGCKVSGPQEKYDYCSVVPKLLIQRYSIIKKSENFSKKEKGKLQFINNHNQELVRIVCP